MIGHILAQRAAECAVSITLSNPRQLAAHCQPQRYSGCAPKRRGTMPVTVTRIYDSPEKARKAADELKKFTSESQIHVVNPSGQNAASLEVALTATGISAGSAKAYAEAVGRGRSVVTVAPSFGSAGRATEVLDAAGPVDTHI